MCHGIRRAVVCTATVAALVVTTGGVAEAGIWSGGLPSYATWIRDVAEVAEVAESYVSERLSDGAAGGWSTERTAIVLDIDNTALVSSYASSWPLPATPPVLAVAEVAAEQGASVFFVTGRGTSLAETSRQNLRAVGYRVDGLYTQSPYSFQTLQTYKTMSRMDIESRGFTIVANIGNNAEDLAGGHAERTFKLPDYDGRLG